MANLFKIIGLTTVKIMRNYFIGRPVCRHFSIYYMPWLFYSNFVSENRNQTYFCWCTCHSVFPVPVTSVNIHSFSTFPLAASHLSGKSPGKLQKTEWSALMHFVERVVAFGWQGHAVMFWVESRPLRVEFKCLIGWTQGRLEQERAWSKRALGSVAWGVSIGLFVTRQVVSSGTS